jgi:hypothetical protein
VNHAPSISLSSNMYRLRIRTSKSDRYLQLVLLVNKTVARKFNHLNVKGKAHPLQAMQAQRGLGDLRLLDFLTSALYGGRLSASRTGRFYPQGHHWYSFSRGLSRPQGHGFVGRKYVTEKSSDTNGNRSRDPPTSSAAP